jgi:hypothetical protein
MTALAIVLGFICFVIVTAYLCALAMPVPDEYFEED